MGVMVSIYQWRYWRAPHDLEPIFCSVQCTLKHDYRLSFEVAPRRSEGGRFRPDGRVVQARVDPVPLKTSRDDVKPQL